MTMPADPTPANARALAEEAIRLAEAATPGPWHVSNSFDIECDTCGESPYVCDLTAEHEDGTAYQSLSMQFCGLESLAKPNAALVAHAGTHYATLARALLAALDREQESKSWQVWTQAHDALTAAGVTGEPGVVARIQSLVDGRDAAYVSFEAACATAEGLKESLLETGEQLDALLADLPHALGRCGCYGAEIDECDTEAHDAAIERLEARIK